jgi:hypothetical protein
MQHASPIAQLLPCSEHTPPPVVSVPPVLVAPVLVPPVLVPPVVVVPGSPVLDPGPVIVLPVDPVELDVLVPGVPDVGPVSVALLLPPPLDPVPALVVSAAEVLGSVVVCGDDVEVSLSLVFPPPPHPRIAASTTEVHCKDRSFIGESPARQDTRVHARPRVSPSAETLMRRRSRRTALCASRTPRAR